MRRRPFTGIARLSDERYRDEERAEGCLALSFANVNTKDWRQLGIRKPGAPDAVSVRV